MTKIISSSECHTIIANYLQADDPKSICIHNYEIRQKIGEVIGFMGEYYGLTIRYSITNEEEPGASTPLTETFFVKLIPVTNPLHKKEIEEKGFFDKEIGIYTQILKELDGYCEEKCFARCLYTRPDMMVLEDLTTRNFRNLKSTATYTMEHFKIVLRSLAMLHVSSIKYEQDTGDNIAEKYGKYLQEMQVTSKNSWYTAGLEGIKAVAKYHPKYQSKEYQAFLDTQLMDQMAIAENLVQPSQEHRNVFCHRDSWDRNILFRTNAIGTPIGCAFVDFQLTRYTPPAIDVLFFIFMNTNAAKRQHILESLLTFYFVCLEEQFSKQNIRDENKIGWLEFRKSCEDIKIVVLILCAMCFPLTCLPANWADEMKRKDQSKFSYYMTVNRNEMLINLIKEYEDYGRILFEAHEELIDYVWAKVIG